MRPATPAPFFEHLNADRQFRCCREELSSPGTECNQRREQSYRLFGQAVVRCLWFGSSEPASRPSATNFLSLAPRMLVAIPSSELLRMSRNDRRFPNMMSRRITKLQVSPSTSAARLIGQLDRIFIIAGSQNKLHNATGFITTQTAGLMQESAMTAVELVGILRY